jgi:hypothetical protein
MVSSCTAALYHATIISGKRFCYYVVADRNFGENNDGVECFSLYTYRHHLWCRSDLSQFAYSDCMIAAVLSEAKKAVGVWYL